MKSAKQIADILGVEKYIVSNYIKRNDINPTNVNGNKFLYDDTICTEIERYLKSNGKLTKNSQIEELTNNIDTLILQNTELIEQNKRLLRLLTQSDYIERKKL